MLELTPRNRRILEAIVEDYIETAEPVGSRSVTRRHQLGLSPATVRNTMADLEEHGYLQQPHTSAGRIPTSRGYRFYVDSLLQVRELTDGEQLRLASHYQLKGLQADVLLRETGKALSSISRYTGIVMAPRLETTVFRHIDFLPLSEGRVLVVFVTRSGLVQNKILQLQEQVSARELEQISASLNQRLKGLSIQEVKDQLFSEMEQEKALYDELQRKTLLLSREALKDDLGGQVFIEGASKILDQPEFADVERMRQLFQAFDQKSQIIDLLDQSQKASGIQIFIGSETGSDSLEGCSMVATHYVSKRGTLGALGVIGPSRMPYSQVIPVVDYTAKLVSQILDQESE